MINRRNFLTGVTAGAAGGLLSNHSMSAWANNFDDNITRSELIQVVDGNMPLLITVPHGGTELVYRLAPRFNIRHRSYLFTIYGVIWSYEIAIEILNYFERYYGLRPYMVMNLAHRRYLDVNREAIDAYEDPHTGVRIYNEYHYHVRRYVNQARIIYKNPLMIDISGARSLYDSIARQTVNGRSVERMITDLGAQGEQAVAGEYGILGELQKRGYGVSPQVGVLTPEEARNYAGYYPLITYGSLQPDGIDAMQLVIGRNYRTAYLYRRTASDLANAIANFMERYVCARATSCFNLA